MKILITGGAGFIASHVADAYLAEGYEVAVLDNLSTGFEKNIPLGAVFYKLDIRDRDGLEQFILDFEPDVISHHAAQMDVRVSTKEPAVDADINIIGTINLLEAAVKANVKKIIYASTGGAVYGEPNQLPVREYHPINPLSQYGISKHTVEHYLYLYQQNFHLDYTILRYPNVYGPRQNPHGEAGVISIFINKIIEGDTPVIFGDGTQERDYVYISDVVQANLQALSMGNGMILNIGSGLGTSVLEIVHTIQAVTKSNDIPIHAPERIGEIKKISLDGTLAREVLEWEPKVPLLDGIRKSYAYQLSQYKKG